MRIRSLSMLALALLLGCAGDASPDQGAGPGRRPGGGPGGWGAGGPGAAAPAAVPVEVAPVERRPISSFIETNGTLEAENEVDVIARTSGPIVELAVEEGDVVRRGQTLARLDDREARARLGISSVALEETRMAYDRAKSLQAESLISSEEFDRALAAFESARAQVEQDRIQLDYTVIAAPFDGLVVARYLKFADQVASGARLFRISDFDPLLCPIQVPERELPKLRVGQAARLTVEAWPGQRFPARVLRISPVVDAATGTVKVTLETRPQDRLRPGMFARVFLETDTRPAALVVPKAALSLESIGDTVFVADGEVASRREVELGFAEGDFVEIVSGVAEGERVVVVGQDGLSDGTPIQVLQAGAIASGAAPDGGGPDEAPGRAAGGPPGGAPGHGPGGRPRLDPATMTPEQLERAKAFMRQKGMTEEQIEQRLRQAGERAASEGQ